MWQGAPWCFTNNAWTLSTEYLIEWGARWGPYMKKEPYRYPTCRAACTLYTFCLMPTCLLLSPLPSAFLPLVSALAPSTILSFGFFSLPCCLLACAPALSLPAFGLLPLPSCLSAYASALPSCLLACAPTLCSPAFDFCPCPCFCLFIAAFSAAISNFCCAIQQLCSTSMPMHAHVVNLLSCCLIGGFPAS